MGDQAEGVDWRDHIVADPEILSGKASVRGTRLSVELVLDMLASGWSVGEVLENYPSLTPERVLAVLAYAADVVRDDALAPLARSIC